MAKNTKSTLTANFLPYQPTSRPDIYEIGQNTWVSVVDVTCLPSHLLSAPQAQAVISNFSGLLNGTLSGDPNPSLTLQFLLLQYPSSFGDLVKKYDDRASALAEAGRADASNIAWAWHEYLQESFTKRIYKRRGAVAITVRPIKTLIKGKDSVLNQEDAFSLLDDIASRVSGVLSEINWGGERLAGDGLAEILSLWALGSARKPGDEESMMYSWEG